MNIGEKLYYLRKKEGYTQEQVAEVCSVSRQSVSKWETNVVNPELEKILILSKFYNVTIDYLMNDNVPIDSLDAFNNINEKASEDQIDEERHVSYFGKLCNIELKGWDTPYLEVIPFADKEGFLFFQNKYFKIGCVQKEYIDSLIILREDSNLKEISIKSDKKNPLLNLINKKCTIQMHSPRIKSFIFDDDGYQGVMLKSCNDMSLTIVENGNSLSIPLKSIAGIEEAK